MSPQAIRRRRAIATISWRTVVVAVIAEACWEAAGMLIIGNPAYSASSYDLLRRVPGGMRAYGVGLALLVLVTVFAYGRHTASTRPRHDQALRVCLAALAAWYTAWMVMVLYTWFVQGHIAAWGGIGKTVFIAAICVIASRSAPLATRA